MVPVGVKPVSRSPAPVVLPGASRLCRVKPVVKLVVSHSIKNNSSSRQEAEMTKPVGLWRDKDLGQVGDPGRKAQPNHLPRNGKSYQESRPGP